MTALLAMPGHSTVERNDIWGRLRWAFAGESYVLVPRGIDGRNGMSVLLKEGATEVIY
jgi:hypothetical protein